MGRNARQSLYSNEVLKNVNTNNQTTKTSSMIWGSQYEQIKIWMKNVENDKETIRGKYYVTNGVGNGNYGTISGVDDGNPSTENPTSTGSQETYRVKKHI